MTTEIAPPVVVPRRKMRWWMPILVLTAAAAYFTRLQLKEDLDTGSRIFISTILAAAATLLVVLWYIFCTSLRWRARLALFGLFILAVCALLMTVRVDGFDGDMHMSLRWRWTPPVDAALPELGTIASKAKSVPTTMRPGSDDFPQFLGQARVGVVESAGLEPDWKKKPPRELWRCPVGSGWGSFAVVGPLAITQEQRGDKELIVARERNSGKVVWSHANANVRFSEAMGGDGPRATPTVDDGRVYALGATGILNCLELASGKLLWSRDGLADSGGANLAWGKSVSPLVYENCVIVTLGDVEQGTLAAYEKDDGKPLWRAGKDKPSYCSPLVTKLAGVPQLVMIYSQSVAAHDPASGQLLWEYAWPTDMYHASQPVPLPGDRLLLTTGFGSPTSLLIQVSHQDSGWSCTKLWANNRLKTKFMTAVVKDNFAYALDDGTLACIDLTSGERVWKDGRYGHGEILLAGNQLIIQAETGFVALVEATPKGFVPSGRIDALSAKTWNHPTLAGRLLFVRNDREAVCYELPVAASFAKE